MMRHGAAKSRSDLREAAEFTAAAGDVTRFRSPAALAATAGLAPVLRQSGQSHTLRCARRGDRNLKRILFQSAFAPVLSTRKPGPTTIPSGAKANITPRPSSLSRAAGRPCSGPCSPTTQPMIPPIASLNNGITQRFLGIRGGPQDRPPPYRQSASRTPRPDQVRTGRT